MTLPIRAGAAISVADSDELAALPLDGLTVGTTAWNVDVGAFFKLTQMDRDEIDIETDDGYDSPTWTLANATFTGHEGCTLVIVLSAPNVAFSRVYTIDTVGSATEVDVLDPPDGETTGELFGSAVLYDDALETDVTVSANGTTGLRWVKQAAAGSGVQTVSASTSNAVDNTDPANPIIKNASASNAGTMSAADKAKVDVTYTRVRGADLTDADVTRNPGRTVGEYVLPAATLTADRSLTLGTGGSPALQTSQKVWVVRRDRSAHTYGVANGGGGGGLLFTFDASPTTDQVAEFFWDSANWLLVGTFPVTFS